MLGTATLVARADGRFDYREQGRLTLAGGHILDAARRYVFAAEPRGFAVLFAETPPRLFHRVALEETASGLAGTGSHRCGDDRYDSRYEFSADGSFTVRHAVIGPRKRYTMTTRYTRAGAGEPGDNSSAARVPCAPTFRRGRK